MTCVQHAVDRAFSGLDNSCVCVCVFGRDGPLVRAELTFTFFCCVSLSLLTRRLGDTLVLPAGVWTECSPSVVVSMITIRGSDTYAAVCVENRSEVNHFIH